MFIIVIPYRNRAVFLKRTINDLQKYLKKNENLLPLGNSYKIIISEQGDNKIFNLSLARNVGALWANLNFKNISHFIFHDVDVIPLLKKDSEYRIEENVLHFLNFGSCKILKDDFFKVNGYNPNFKGWGNEDNEFACRLHNFQIQHTKRESFSLIKHGEYEELKRTPREKLFYKNLEKIYFPLIKDYENWHNESTEKNNQEIFQSFLDLKNENERIEWSKINGLNLIDATKIKFINNYKTFSSNLIYRISFNSEEIIQSDPAEACWRKSTKT